MKQERKSLFPFTVEDAKAILARYTRKEIDEILAKAKEEGEKISSPESRYQQPVTYQDLNQHYPG